jgi:hypothetical protein
MTDLDTLAAEAGYKLLYDCCDRWACISAVPQRPKLPARHCVTEITAARPPVVAAALCSDDMRRALCEALAEQHGTFRVPSRIEVPS